MKSTNQESDKMSWDSGESITCGFKRISLYLEVESEHDEDK